MRKITLRLTDEEYAALEARAQADRRSVREMAERLVTQPSPFVPLLPYIQPTYPPQWPYTITSGDTTADPGGYTVWKNQNATASPSSMPTP